MQAKKKQTPILRYWLTQMERGGLVLLGLGHLISRGEKTPITLPLPVFPYLGLNVLDLHGSLLAQLHGKSCVATHLVYRRRHLDLSAGFTPRCLNLLLKRKSALGRQCFGFGGDRQFWVHNAESVFDMRQRESILRVCEVHAAQCKFGDDVPERPIKMRGGKEACEHTRS